jgi:hypothetical protein
MYVYVRIVRCAMFYVCMFIKYLEGLTWGEIGKFPLRFFKKLMVQTQVEPTVLKGSRFFIWVAWALRHQKSSKSKCGYCTIRVCCHSKNIMRIELLFMMPLSFKVVSSMSSLPLG